MVVRYGPSERLDLLYCRRWLVKANVLGYTKDGAMGMATGDTTSQLRGWYLHSVLIHLIRMGAMVGREAAKNHWGVAAGFFFCLLSLRG